MEVLGKIKMIGVEQQVSDTFKKRELVITTDEQYPQHILVVFNQDKCDLLNAHKVGEAVTVSVNLRGREWTNPQGETVYFNTIQGWRIEKVAVATPTQEPVKTTKTAKTPSPVLEPALAEDEPDDLPF